MTFKAGDTALLIDEKGRRFLLRLDPSRTFQYHLGSISHEDLIGRADGTWVDSSSGGRMLLIRPRLADYIIKMKRGAQVVYPKDIGPMLVYTDIGPGMTVLEAGTGSGALTLALTRAVGANGKVVSVERRDDHAAHARKAIERWFGEIPAQLDLRIGDVADHVGEVAPDRLLLDLPDPSEAVAAAATGMPTGGVVSIYLPTVPQVERVVAQARDGGSFAEIEIKEIIMRDWNIDGRSVRPEHRMVGHTGFLVFMRRIAHQSTSDSGSAQ
jgi:tRNA (adenine57-N1/adenine58-N1)-methyltransferase catalytic subunit